MSWKSWGAYGAMAGGVLTMSGCTGTVDVAAEASATADASSQRDSETAVAREGGLDSSVEPVVGAESGVLDAAPHDANGALEAGTAADAALDSAVTPGSGCGSASYLLCEDFESAAEGTLPAGWTVLSAWGGGSAPKVVSDAHHGGQRALETGLALNGQTRAQHSLSSLGAAASKHWGRVFYRAKLPAPPPSNGVLHNTLVALRAGDESRVVDTVIASNGAHQFLYNIPDDSFGKGSSYDYHSYDGAWHCAEWYVDTSMNAYRFFYDGAEVSSIAFSGETAARLAAFTSIALGFINYQTPASAYDGWFDDLALDDTRVGCD